MKDRKGNEIIIGHRCVVDNKVLGVVTSLNETTAVILMLKENSPSCYEENVEPDRIEMKD